MAKVKVREKSETGVYPEDWVKQPEQQETAIVVVYRDRLMNKQKYHRFFRVLFGLGSNGS